MTTPPAPLPPDRHYSGSESARQLIGHVIAEMPWRVVFAFMFVAFFFFYGMVNSIIKLLGRDVASIDFPLGVVVGALCATAVLVLAIVIKRRRT